MTTTRFPPEQARQGQERMHEEYFSRCISCGEINDYCDDCDEFYFNMPKGKTQFYACTSCVMDFCDIDHLKEYINESKGEDSDEIFKQMIEEGNSLDGIHSALKKECLERFKVELKDKTKKYKRLRCTIKELKHLIKESKKRIYF